MSDLMGALNYKERHNNSTPSITVTNVAQNRAIHETSVVSGCCPVSLDAP